MNPDDPDDPASKCRFYWDTGSGKCMMRFDWMWKNFERLRRQGAILVAIKPFKVGLFDVGAFMTIQLIFRNVPVVLGKAVYRADFLISPDAAFENALGSDFTALNGLVVDMERGQARITVRPEQLLNGARMPRCPSWADENWVPKQRLPCFYEGKMLELEAHDNGV
jgi:hypothetical protein